MNIEHFKKDYEDNLEKQKSKAKLNIVLEDIYRLVTLTKQNIHFWRIIHESLKTKPEIIELASLFFMNYGVLLLNASTLDISKLFDRDKDSMNLQYFFNLAINEGHKYLDSKTHKKLVEQIKKDQTDLSKFQDIIEKIKTKRDRQLAHLDKRLMGKGYSEKDKIEIEELEKTVNKIDHILTEYFNITQYQKLNNFNDYLTILKKYGIVTDLNNVLALLDFALDNIAIDTTNEAIKEAIKTREIQRLIEKELKNE